MSRLDTTRLKRLAFNDQGFAFDPQTGESYTLNASARHIVRDIVSGAAYSDITARLASTYQRDEREVSRDFIDFLEQLRALQLVGGEA